MTTDTELDEPGLRERWALLPWWGQALAVFGGSRVITTLLFLWVGTQATVSSRAGANPSFLSLTTAWDGQWYWLIAERGYPLSLQLTASGTVDTNQWAFLPVYPLLVKLLALGNTAAWPAVAFLVSLTAGFACAVLLAVLLRPHIGERRAVFAVAVFGCSPLSFVLQMAYAESLGLALVLAALCLIDRHRYRSAIPVAVLLAFTRPGVLALGLTVAAHLVLRFVATRRGKDSLTARDARRGVLLGALTVPLGFAWGWIAGAVTGVPDAYIATEMSWRALWMTDPHFELVTPWFFAGDFWFGPVLGPVVVVVLVLGFAAALFLPQVRRLGATARLWCASWAVYLLLVFFPQSSLFRLLMPMAPLAGAITPRRTGARVAVLGLGVALQALWMWVVLGPFQTYWSVP